MRSISHLAALAALALLPTSAAAQTRSLANLASVSADPQYASSPSDQSPSIDQLARQSYSPYSNYDQSCSPQREAQLRRVAMMQQRRQAEQSRRQTSRERLPRPVQDDERLAAGKFQAAHLLWQGGNTAAARKWLGEILDKFPSTETATRARLTLARL